MLAFINVDQFVAQALVVTFPMVVGEVALQVAAQGALVPDDDVIEALAPEGADRAFNPYVERLIGSVRRECLT